MSTAADQTRVPGGPLAALTDLPALVRDLLRGDGPFAGASAEWRSFLEAAPVGPGPLWSDAAFVAGVRESWRDAEPDAAALAAVGSALDDLASGRAAVVVTGQQPGFLGGPLLTLFKAAACVAAARARTAKGLPTVPLFWSGDDDDDRREAFAPRLYDPRRRVLLSAPAPPGADHRMVGAAPAAEWAAPEAAWLAEADADGRVAAGALSALWTRARDDGWSWGRLQRAALLRLFAGEGLLVVSGNDPHLHAAAAPLYAEIAGRLDELRDLAAARGEELVRNGYHAQIGEGSLRRPLNVQTGDERERLADGALPPPARLRPGVMLRTLVQDWAFRPAGIVGGPGELSYLEQLRPLHAALDVTQPALLPRLFATLSDDPHRDRDAAAAVATADSTDAAVRDAHESAVVAQAREALRDALSHLPGLDAETATELSARAARSWTGAVRDALARGRAAASSPAQRPESPVWVAPGGRRQERVMAMHWATALWGAGPKDSALAAAEAHFERGAAGDWREWWLGVEAR